MAGAALQIGPELAVTDSEGNFMVRLKKAGRAESEDCLRRVHDSGKICDRSSAPDGEGCARGCRAGIFHCAAADPERRFFRGPVSSAGYAGESARHELKQILSVLSPFSVSSVLRLAVAQA